MTTARTTRTTRTTPTSITFDSQRELKTVQRAARLAGKSVSRFLRDLGVVEARRLIAEHEGTHVCAECGNRTAACGNGTAAA